MRKSTIELEELDNIVHLSNLYDIYGDLLSNNKKEVFEDYFLNDLSLSEIAKKQGISRQGIHNTVKKTSEELREYESKIHLLYKFTNIEEKLNEINRISDKIKDKNNSRYITDIKNLVENISKEL